MSNVEENPEAAELNEQQEDSVIVEDDIDSSSEATSSDGVDDTETEMSPSDHPAMELDEQLFREIVKEVVEADPLFYEDMVLDEEVLKGLQANVEHQVATWFAFLKHAAEHDNRETITERDVEFTRGFIGQDDVEAE